LTPLDQELRYATQLELKRVDPEEDVDASEALPREVWAKLNSITRKVKSVEILNEVFTMGRVADNDIQVHDPRLSGKHCKIMRKFDKEGRMIVVLEDSSSNGTYINGETVSNCH
jgi:pSer/pThr/pTyr-binding forkhead associated (FHA) protein